MAFLVAAPSHTLTAASSEWPRRLRRIAVWREIKVIPVGSNIPREELSTAARRAVRERFGVDDGTLLVGGFGSAGPDRTADLAIEAAAEVGRAYPLKVVWLGATRTTPLSSGIYGPAVVWTGPLPHPEISKLMGACDVFVLPFRDGISTRRGSLAAALLHRLPVLTTRGRRVDRMFVHRENVYLVPAGDGRALADALRELASCPELRARLAHGAQALHLEHFSWEVIARCVALQMGVASPE